MENPIDRRPYLEAIRRARDEAAPAVEAFLATHPKFPPDESQPGFAAYQAALDRIQVAIDAARAAGVPDAELYEETRLQCGRCGSWFIAGVATNDVATYHLTSAAINQGFLPTSWAVLCPDCGNASGPDDRDRCG